VIVDLQSSIFATPKRMYDLWCNANAAVALEAQDAFLGRMCKGRLAMVRGQVAEAESLWREVANDFPQRLEPHLELWQLNAMQGAHKKAVLDIRRVVELVGSGKSDWHRCVHIDVDLLFDSKVWTGSADVLAIEDVVHLLLGKSLRLSKLWDHAWHALNNGYEHSSKAHGPFLFQIGKLSVQAAQDKLGIHSERVGENPGRVGLVDPLVLERWLSRGHEHLEKFRTHERTKADFRKGRRYRELLEKCKRAAQASHT